MSPSSALSRRLFCGLAVLEFTLLVVPDCLAQGQQDTSGEASIQIERSSEYKKEGPSFEKSVEVNMQYQGNDCKADLQLEYYQQGTNAHVKSTLSNDQCGDSFGKYALRVRFKEIGDDELQSTDFEEEWQRKGNDPLVVEKDYFVGDNVDIVRVSSRGLSCECAQESDESQQAE